MAISKRSKLLISIIVSFLVLAASVTVLLIFLLKENKDDPTPSNPNPPVITDDKYTDENKNMMVSAIKDFLSIDESLLDSQELWIKEILEKTLDNIPNAFEKAGINIQVYANVVNYIQTLKSKLSTIEFDFSDIVLEDGNINFSQIMQVFGKMENINKVYALFSDFYASGLTNTDIGRVMYYFIDAEIQLLDEYSVSIMLYLSEILPSNEIQVLLSGLFIDFTTFLSENFNKIPADDFAVAMGSMLDAFGKFFEIYKTLNIYTIVELFDNIKSGNLSAAELDTLVTSFKSQIEELIDPETGKVISIPKDAYKTIFSITTKIPALTSLLKTLGVPIPEDFDIMSYLTPLIDAMPYVEDFINRAVYGIVNVLDKINNTTKLYRLDENGEQYIESVTMAQAIIDNVSEIVDEDTINVNVDTLIIISKILSGMFESNALSLEFINSFVDKLRPTMSNIFNLIKQIREDNETDYEALMDNYLIQIKKIITTINVVANCDLGTNEDKLLELSPDMIVLYDQIEVLFKALGEQDILTMQQVLYAFAGFIFAPVIIISFPVLIVGFPLVYGLTFVFVLFMGTGVYYFNYLFFVGIISLITGQDFNLPDISEVFDNIFNVTIENLDIEAIFNSYFTTIKDTFMKLADAIDAWFKQSANWTPVAP